MSNNGELSKSQYKKLLKQFGLDNPNKKSKTSEELSYRIEEGKNKHRRFVQEIKNNEIRNRISKDPESVDKNNIFFYRGQGTPEYDSFKSLLTNTNWDEIGENEETPE